MSDINISSGDSRYRENLVTPITLKRTTLYLIFSLIFALVYQLPGWPNIFHEVYGYPMIDRTVYENALISENLVIDYIKEFTPIMYFTFEWSWHSLLAYLHRHIGLSIDHIFFLITTFVIFRFSMEVITKAGWQFLPFLINPLVVDFAFSQLRLALAIALISFVWRRQWKIYYTAAIYIIAASIHTSIVLFCAAHIAAHLFYKKKLLSVITLLFIGAIMSLATGPLREKILFSIGDRRAYYDDMSSSIAYLSFWIFMLAIVIISTQLKHSKFTLDIRYSIVILSTIAVNVVTGGYSTRFIAASFPSLLISMGGLGAIYSRVVIIIFALYSSLQWMYWFRILS